MSSLEAVGSTELYLSYPGMPHKPLWAARSWDISPESFERTRAELRLATPANTPIATKRMRIGKLGVSLLTKQDLNRGLASSEQTQNMGPQEIEEALRKGLPESHRRKVSAQVREVGPVWRQHGLKHGLWLAIKLDAPEVLEEQWALRRGIEQLGGGNVALAEDEPLIAFVRFPGKCIPQKSADSLRQSVGDELTLHKLTFITKSA